MGFWKGVLGAAKSAVKEGASIAAPIVGGAFGGPAGAKAGAMIGSRIAKAGSAKSITEARSQDRSRMADVYGYGGRAGV